MTETTTSTHLIEDLRKVQQGLTETVSAMPPAQFDHATESSWAASGYLKHLLLSIKPITRLFEMSPQTVSRRFGSTDAPPSTFDAVVAKYRSVLANGARAEDHPGVVPDSYRMPEDVTDPQAHLLDRWNDANERLLTAIPQWSDQALDSTLVPHPAIGLISMREMLYFTLYHNTLHWNDIKALA